MYESRVSVVFFWQSRCEFLRVFALHMDEIAFHPQHIGIDIALGYETVSAFDELLAIVHRVEQDRNLGFLRNEIESFLPVGIQRACAFRRDAQPKRRALDGCVSKRIGHMGVFGSEDRYASDGAKDRSERPSKPFFLHQEIDAYATGEHIEQTHDEIPITGGRCQTNDTFLGERLLVLDGPFHTLDEKPIAELLNHNRVFRNLQPTISRGC